jgi:ActR/RegA family two-component response regulator
MLAACRAYVIAQDEPQNRSLIRLAERASFGMVGTVLGERRVMIEAGHGDLVYFFVHHRLPDAAMLAVIHRIRSSSEDAIRYAPVVLVIDDCPLARALKYARFGYDDILVLPQKCEAIIAHLERQIDTEHVYIEAPNYLGPDRRRLDHGFVRDERRTGEQPHVRLVIYRSVEDGVRVVRRQLRGRTAATPRFHFVTPQIIASPPARAPSARQHRCSLAF